MEARLPDWLKPAGLVRWRLFFLKEIELKKNAVRCTARPSDVQRLSAVKLVFIGSSRGVRIFETSD